MAKVEVEKTSNVPEVQDENAENALTEAADISDTFSEESEPDKAEDAAEEDEDYNDRKKKKKKKIIILLSVIVGIIVILIATFTVVKIVKDKAAAKNKYTDVAVETRTISNTISGSSSIEPNDSYNVTTIKSGDITADYIKEGDVVSKDDKLYQFDDEDARNSLTSAQNALTKAEQAYVDAVKQKAQTVSSNSIGTKNAQNSVTKALNSLSDAEKTYDDQYPKSEVSGKVKSVSVKEGDTVNNGAEIATIYNDSTMKIRLPFNDYDAANVYVGADALVYVTGSREAIYGTVTDKSTESTATDSHTMVVYATIEVTNPGALTESDTGSATVNGVACSDTAKFEYSESQKVQAKVSGTVKELNISEGDSVYNGQQLAYISSDNVSSSISNAKLSYDDAVLSLQKQVLQNDTFSQDSSIKNAQLALEDAKLNLQKAQDSVEDYTVTAPIEGTVVTKNAKAGDTIDSSNGSDPLCVIYDLSSVKCSIEVDETEIGLVKTGQKATVTADAVDGTFEGEVIKVPVDGVNQNGVTTYTIEVQIDDYGDLLPGMNVNAEIVVEEAEDVLAIPVNSVNRGNIVFVKDDGTEHENDVTDLIKNKETKNNTVGGDNQDNGDKKNDDSDNKDKMPAGEKPDGEPGGERPDGDNADDKSSEKSSGGLDTSQIPTNIEIPDGYRAILVETGINDSDYIEIKSGLKETDLVRTLNTQSSSANASFGNGEEAEAQAMQGMGGAMGGMGGGMQGGGGMAGGGGGGSRGGGGGMPGGR